MKVARLKIEDYKVMQHHPGVEQPFDVALCGQDLIGDETLGWSRAKIVEGKITCPVCAKIIDECRKVQRSEYVLSKKHNYL